MLGLYFIIFIDKKERNGEKNEKHYGNSIKI